jgi:putative heme-binding domain-containing protein
LARTRARRSGSQRWGHWPPTPGRRPPGRCWNAIRRPIRRSARGSWGCSAPAATGPAHCWTPSECYPSADPSLRARILGLLCTRRDWAGALLDAIKRHHVAAKDLTPAHARLIVQLGDPALAARLESAWGKVPRAGSPEKDRRIAEIRGLLPEGDKGNAARGQPIFKEHCAVCHRLFGEGESIGPDLTGAERGDLDFLMTSLVDPGRQIRKEFQSQTIALRDGRVLTGLVVDEDDRTLTLVDGSRQKTVVPRDAVDEARLSEVSVMPEGLLDKLTEPQIRDLFRYIQSAGGR